MRAAFECSFVVVVGPFSTPVVDHIISASASSCTAITKSSTYSTFIYIIINIIGIYAHTHLRHDLALIILYYLLHFFFWLKRGTRPSTELFIASKRPRVWYHESPVPPLPASPQTQKFKPNKTRPWKGMKTAISLINVYAIYYTSS